MSIPADWKIATLSPQRGMIDQNQGRNQHPHFQITWRCGFSCIILYMFPFSRRKKHIIRYHSSFFAETFCDVPMFFICNQNLMEFLVEKKSYMGTLIRDMLYPLNCWWIVAYMGTPIWDILYSYYTFWCHPKNQFYLPISTIHKATFYMATERFQEYRIRRIFHNFHTNQDHIGLPPTLTRKIRWYRTGAHGVPILWHLWCHPKVQVPGHTARVLWGPPAELQWSALAEAFKEDHVDLFSHWRRTRLG